MVINQARITNILIIVVFIFLMFENTAFSFLEDKDILFSLETKYQTVLDKETLSDDLRQEFTKSNIQLSQNVNVSKSYEWKEGFGTPTWLVIDKDNEKMYVAIKKEKINAYLYENPFLPIDEADQDPDFKKFRDDLIIAIKDKNIKFLLDHIDKKIKYSFGSEESTIAGFKKYWKLSEPEKSEIWSELERVLSFGGSFDEDKTSFTAPIFFVKWPANIFDQFSCMVITGNNVNVRSEPNSKSDIVAKLSYSIVYPNYDIESSEINETINGETYPWKEISTIYGVRGYVFGKYLRSSIDYRARFEKKNGIWKMVFFIKGD